MGNGFIMHMAESGEDVALTLARCAFACFLRLLRVFSHVGGMLCRRSRLRPSCGLLVGYFVVVGGIIPGEVFIAPSIGGLPNFVID